jgi:hypothetical protein
MHTLCENSKEEYPNSVTEFVKLEEERFLQGVSYVINNILYLIKIDM